ncbi:MAG TPA: hypothetical protein VH589_10725 [Trebonia sp.]|jgi:hypothetical protein
MTDEPLAGLDPAGHGETFAGLDPADGNELLADVDPAGLAAAFHRVADRLEAVKRDSEERDSAEAEARERQDQALAKYGRVNRRLVIIDIALTVLTVGLSVWLGIVANQASNATSSASKAQIAAAAVATSNRNLCLSGNAARVEQIQLWDYILSIGRQPQTPAQRKATAEFRARLNTLFAPRDCNRISPGHP